MYYIYHIKGVKIGCSTEPKRRVGKQGYLEYEILETHSDIHIASEREIELQKQYGYKVDNTLYSQSYEWCTSGNPPVEPMLKGYKDWALQNPHKVKEIQSLGGKVQGKIQGEKNKPMLSNLGKKMSEFNNRIRTCPHCGITTRGVGYERWHGDKCKKNPNL